MAKIQGVTIELSADASGIEQALSDVNKQANKTTKELGQINGALKFDSNNTVLLSQKFEVLQDTIVNTKDKLDALKKAQADLDAQAASGKNIAPEQFRALAREIEQTEGILRGFKKQAENVQVKLDVKADTVGIDKMKSAIEELPNAAKSAASAAGSAITGIGSAAAASAAAVGGLVVGMTETNRDLAITKTQLDQVGLSLDDVTAATVAFTSVGQEADQVAEVFGNLSRAGFETAQEINSISEGLAGVITAFGDGFNVEGLSESILLTTQLGESTGMFTDLLERLGINTEDYNAKLAAASSEQERANIIAQTFADEGLNKLFEAYASGNPEIIAQAEANQELQQKLSELSVALTPLVTTMTEFGNVLLDVALGNKTLSEAFEELSDKASSAFEEFGGKGVEALDNLLEGMEGALPQLVSFIQEMVTGLLDELTDSAPDFIDKGADIVSEFATGLSETIPEIGTKAIELIETLIESIIDNLPQILETGSEVVSNLLRGISSMLPQLIVAALNLIVKLAAAIIANLPTIIQAGVNILLALIEGIVMTIGRLGAAIVTKVIPGIFKAFLGEDWASIGKDVIAGIAKGITKFGKNAVEAITGVVNSVIKKAKSLLKINSPSKVFTQFGEWIGIGLADGMESTESLNEKIMKDLTGKILDVKEDSKNKLIKIDADLAKEIQKANSNAEDKILKIQKTAAKKKQALTTEQSKQIEKIRRESADKVTKLEEKAVTDRAKIATDEKKLIEEHYKTLFENVKTFVDNKKSLNQMSIVDEAAMWRESVSLFAEGSDQRIKAQQEYKKALENVQKEITSINSKYQNEMKAIDDEYLKSAQKITDDYDKTYNDRLKALSSFATTFQEFTLELGVSGSELTQSLRNQVDALTMWMDEFKKISRRGINADLLDEISELGVKALPELVALNEMTDEQLSEYSDLYSEKAKLAREQTEKEMQGMRLDMSAELSELRATADKQLELLSQNWYKDIKSITQTTSDELYTLEKIGEEAANGLYRGLNSMSDKLTSKAREIANAIADEMRSALDIHSPSRITQEIGVNVGQGVIVGMDDMVKKIAQSSARLSNAASGALSSLASSSVKSQTNQVVQQRIYNNQSTDMTGLIQAIAELAQRPVQTSVNMDGRVIADAVSSHQYNKTSLSALRKGVSL